MRSSTFEQALTKQGVEWEYVDAVPLEEINLERGIKNQARLELPLDAELVEQYVHAKKQGMEFPAVVLYKKGRTYTPADGNHRLAADGQCGRKATDAYIVKTQDPLVLDRLTRVFNNLVNGRRLTNEESVAHALWMMRTYGLTIEAAANEWGISRGRLSKALMAENARAVCNAQNVKHVSRLTEGQLVHLAPLAKVGEDVLAKAATIAIENGLNNDDVLKMRKAVDTARTHAQKMSVLKGIEEAEETKNRKAQTKGGEHTSKKTMPRDRLAAYVKHGLRMLEEYSQDFTWRQPGHAFKETRQAARDFVNRLIGIYQLGQHVPQEGSDEKRA